MGVGWGQGGGKGVRVMSHHPPTHPPGEGVEGREQTHPYHATASILPTMSKEINRGKGGTLSNSNPPRAHNSMFPSPTIMGMYAVRPVAIITHPLLEYCIWLSVRLLFLFLFPLPPGVAACVAGGKHGRPAWPACLPPPASAPLQAFFTVML